MVRPFRAGLIVLLICVPMMASAEPPVQAVCESGSFACSDGSGCCSNGTICGTGRNGCDADKCCRESDGNGGGSLDGVECSCDTAQAGNAGQIHICTQATGATCDTTRSSGFTCTTNSLRSRLCSSAGAIRCCQANAIVTIAYDDCDDDNCSAAGFSRICAGVGGDVVSCRSVLGGSSSSSSSSSSDERGSSSSSSGCSTGFRFVDQGGLLLACAALLLLRRRQ